VYRYSHKAQNGGTAFLEAISGYFRIQMTHEQFEHDSSFIGRVAWLISSSVASAECDAALWTLYISRLTNKSFEFRLASLHMISCHFDVRHRATFVVTIPHRVTSNAQAPYRLRQLSLIPKTHSTGARCIHVPDCIFPPSTPPLQLPL
jgi:hypothetical protein